MCSNSYIESSTGGRLGAVIGRVTDLGGRMPNDYQLDDPFDEDVVTEVIRPAAIVPEEAARAILVELSLHGVTSGGNWLAEASRWNRYDRPWASASAPGGAGLLGSIQIAYGTPTKYEITIYRVTITQLGSQQGWSVQTLSDEALGFGDLTLAQCPRAPMQAPPRPFRY